MADRVYTGDVGLIVEIDVVDTISTATITQIAARKPDATEVTWDATVYGTTKIRYQTVSGDLNVQGIYYLQPIIAFSGWTGRGKTVKFTVYDKFE